MARLNTATQARETILVDLVSQSIELGRGALIAFTVEPARREALLNGWDDIGRIRAHFGCAITYFEDRQRAACPWLWPTEQGPVNG